MGFGLNPNIRSIFDALKARIYELWNYLLVEQLIDTFRQGENMSAKSLLQTPHFWVGVEALKRENNFGRLVRLDKSYWEKTTSFTNYIPVYWISKSGRPSNNINTCDGQYFGYRLEIISKTENKVNFKIAGFGTTSFPRPIANIVNNPAPFVMDSTKHSVEIKMIEDTYIHVLPSQNQLSVPEGAMIAGYGFFNVEQFYGLVIHAFFDVDGFSRGPIYNSAVPKFPNTYINAGSFDVGTHYIISFHSQALYFDNFILNSASMGLVLLQL